MSSSDDFLDRIQRQCFPLLFIYWYCSCVVVQKIISDHSTIVDYYNSSHSLMARAFLHVAFKSIGTSQQSRVFFVSSTLFCPLPPFAAYIITNRIPLTPLSLTTNQHHDSHHARRFLPSIQIQIKIKFSNGKEGTRRVAISFGPSEGNLGGEKTSLRKRMHRKSSIVLQTVQH